MNYISLVLRGGSWFDDPWDCRSACRLRLNPDNRGDYVGFRVACSPAIRSLHSSPILEETMPDINIEMVEIPAGSFIMGDDASQWASEKPAHEVNVAAFEMGKFPVTQAQWRAVAALPQIERELAPDPSRFEGDNRPVECVSWHDAVEFCSRLSQLYSDAEWEIEYRLPTEAEWEYACRAGTTTQYPSGDSLTAKDACFDQWETCEVGTFPPNVFGLYDMIGNVWEWCQDIWHDSYKGAPADGSAWVDSPKDE